MTELIKVGEIIKARGLDVDEVARQLFPTHKYPDLALRRVIQHKGSLTPEQVSKLALLADLTISDIFYGENWKASTGRDLHVFTNKSFRAELDPNTWVTRLFHNDSLFHESIIYSGSTPLSKYFAQLNILINNFINSEKNDTD